MTDETRIMVWDIAVRIFHWSLVILFFAAYLSGDDESTLHLYAGYGVLALLAFRIVWGFVGTKHARFADFIYGPAATMQYLKSLASGKPKHYLGHNPLGGWMAVALLACLLGTVWSGLEAYAVQGEGPLAMVETRVGSRLFPVSLAHDDTERNGEHEGKGGDEFWEEIHETLSNLTLFLVFLHVAGALASSRLHRENLVRAMITGYKARDTK